MTTYNKSRRSQSLGMKAVFRWPAAILDEIPVSELTTIEGQFEAMLRVLENHQTTLLDFGTLFEELVTANSKQKKGETADQAAARNRVAEGYAGMSERLAKMDALEASVLEHVLYGMKAVQDLIDYRDVYKSEADKIPGMHAAFTDTHKR